ncbi:MAG TPA: ATP-binding protein [Pseudomonadales bacterium]|nr:ATP-binding protein [Pseudomonadales bacterium]
MNFNLNTWSITRRLLVAGLLMIPLSLTLLGVGYFVASNNAAHVAQRQYMQLAVYWLLANADITDEGRVVMGALVEEPRLATPQSGFYAAVTDVDGTIYWRSASSVAVALGDLTTNLNDVPFGTDAFFAQASALSHYRRPVRWELPSGEQVALIFHVFEEGNRVREQSAAHEGVLRVSYIATTFLLLAVLLFIVRWGLRPLTMVVAQLQRVEQGRADQIVGVYPRELNDLIGAINRLLGNERKQRERYRSALSDLAHSLKTPLSVLRNDVQQLSGEARDNADKAVTNMQEIIDYQLQRAAIQSQDSLARQRIDLYIMVERVVQSLAKVYLERELTLEVCGSSQWVQGDKRDLLELIGNLADNACKAASHRVRLTVAASDGQVLLSVEDDGAGIDPSMLETITRRGQRADQYESGHGIGLAMVADIVASMKGKMTLQHSDLGGARFDVQLPCPGSD